MTYSATDFFRDATNGVNKVSNGVTTLGSDSATSQEREAAIVAIGSGVANLASALLNSLPAEIASQLPSGLADSVTVVGGALNLSTKGVRDI